MLILFTSYDLGSLFHLSFWCLIALLEACFHASLQFGAFGVNACITR